MPERVIATPRTNGIGSTSRADELSLFSTGLCGTGVFAQTPGRCHRSHTRCEKDRTTPRNGDRGRRKMIGICRHYLLFDVLPISFYSSVLSVPLWPIIPTQSLPDTRQNHYVSHIRSLPHSLFFISLCMPLWLIILFPPYSRNITDIKVIVFPIQ